MLTDPNVENHRVVGFLRIACKMLVGIMIYRLSRIREGCVCVKRAGFVAVLVALSKLSP